MKYPCGYGLYLYENEDRSNFPYSVFLFLSRVINNPFSRDILPTHFKDSKRIQLLIKQINRKDNT